MDLPAPLDEQALPVQQALQVQPVQVTQATLEEQAAPDEPDQPVLQVPSQV